MNADSPVELEFAAVFEAEFEDEARLHRQFDDFHLRGSWFTDSAEIKAAIARIKSGLGARDIIDDASRVESHRSRVNRAIWAARSPTPSETRESAAS
jgi:hypothetical protein